MAEESKGGGPVTDAVIFIGVLILLIAVWFARGAASAADLRGIFLHPPLPVGPGGAYGSQIGNIASTTPYTPSSPSYTQPQYTQ